MSEEETSQQDSDRESGDESGSDKGSNSGSDNESGSDKDSDEDDSDKSGSGSDSDDDKSGSDSDSDSDKKKKKKKENAIDDMQDAAASALKSTYKPTPFQEAMAMFKEINFDLDDVSKTIEKVQMKVGIYASSSPQKSPQRRSSPPRNYFPPENQPRYSPGGGLKRGMNTPNAQSQRKQVAYADQQYAQEYEQDEEEYNEQEFEQEDQHQGTYRSVANTYRNGPPEPMMAVQQHCQPHPNNFGAAGPYSQFMKPHPQQAPQAVYTNRFFNGPQPVTASLMGGQASSPSSRFMNPQNRMPFGGVQGAQSTRTYTDFYRSANPAGHQQQYDQAQQQAMPFVLHSQRQQQQNSNRPPMPPPQQTMQHQQPMNNNIIHMQRSVPTQHSTSSFDRNTAPMQNNFMQPSQHTNPTGHSQMQASPATLGPGTSRPQLNPNNAGSTQRAYGGPPAANPTSSNDVPTGAQLANLSSAIDTLLAQ